MGGGDLKRDDRGTVEQSNHTQMQGIKPSHQLSSLGTGTNGDRLMSPDFSFSRQSRCPIMGGPGVCLAGQEGWEVGS